MVVERSALGKGRLQTGWDTLINLKHEGNVLPFFNELDRTTELRLIKALELYPFQTNDGVKYSDEAKKAIANGISYLIN
jgi:hypothetical protein